ncbi:STAS domain-containing protein [Streptomyces sp. NPDC012825]|uniref:STAS domain-containing protein n=1 Tax=Streptomyces sp. NPDC012825 TaxID=3364851 RepID=UPI0036ABC199
MDTVPDSITPVRLGEVLLVTFPTDLTDELAVRTQRDLSAMVARGGIRGVVIDVSAMWVVDTFICRVLADTAAAVKLLAAETVVAGLRPAIAMTLVELGMTLSGLRTALNTEAALARLGAGARPSMEKP